jgi:hypothetical protein
LFGGIGSAVIEEHVWRGPALYRHRDASDPTGNSREFGEESIGDIKRILRRVRPSQLRQPVSAVREPMTKVQDRSKFGNCRLALPVLGNPSIQYVFVEPNTGSLLLV